MKYKVKGGYMSQAQLYQRVDWCLQTFGPMSTSRWFAHTAVGIRFEHEKDYTWYMLRWSA